MPEKTRGIVLSTQSYSETSLISRIFTRTFGLQSYIIKGARRKNSKISTSALQAPSLVELVAYHRDSRSLQTLSDVEHSPTFKTITQNHGKRTMALFLVDLLYRCIREEEKNEKMFDFIDQSFRMLDEMQSAYENFHLRFMLELSKFLGFYPGNALEGSDKYFDISEGRFTSVENHSDLIADEQTSRNIFLLLQSGLSSTPITGSSDMDCRKVFNTLIGFYEYHHLQGNRIRSRYLIDEVLN